MNAKANAMRTDSNTYAGVRTPAYILEEARLRRNLRLIADVARRGRCDIILAFKAFALWKAFPIVRQYVGATTASSLAEARLAVEKFGSAPHVYSPAYTDGDIDELARAASHLTFNSLSQAARYAARAKAANPRVSLGLRVNPEYSEVGTALYNPCAPGTRFGVTADKLPPTLPPGIDGLHFHCHCESGADALERTLAHIEAKFGPWLRQAKWLNLGGGHLMTRRGYDVERLVALLQGLHRRYPALHLVMEPGSAFAWQTGPLVAEVVDVVEDRGIKTAVLNVSFTCHMPDCLEMPYHPEVRFAELRPLEEATLENTYRLGGNSCLSGDFMGSWRFGHALQAGDRVIFEDMMHYTTVKTCTFNGVAHPDIDLLHEDGELEVLRHFTPEDYIMRMD